MAHKKAPLAVFKRLELSSGVKPEKLTMWVKADG